jgi:hypothetical protein
LTDFAKHVFLGNHDVFKVKRAGGGCTDT